MVSKHCHAVAYANSDRETIDTIRMRSVAHQIVAKIIQRQEKLLLPLDRLKRYILSNRQQYPDYDTSSTSSSRSTSGYKQKRAPSVEADILMVKAILGVPSELSGSRARGSGGSGGSIEENLLLLNCFTQSKYLGERWIDKLHMAYNYVREHFLPAYFMT